MIPSSVGVCMGGRTVCVPFSQSPLPCHVSRVFSSSSASSRQPVDTVMASARKQRVSPRRSVAAASVTSSPEVSVDEVEDAQPAVSPITQEYTGASIRVMEGLEAVRKRPGMYIGNTGPEGLHHLVFELVDNAVDEVMAGHASQLAVEMDLASRWVTVEDDGRGIPTDPMPGQKGQSALTVVACQLHAGGKFGDGGYKASGGLHGVGLSCVNALSDEMEVTVWRRGVEFRQTFSRGKPTSPVTQKPAADVSKRGTRVRYVYDTSIFRAEDLAYRPAVIEERLKELAYLNRGLRVRFRALEPGADGASAPWTEFRSEGGLKELVRDVVASRPSAPALHPEALYASREVEGVGVEVALQWTQSVEPGSCTVMGYTNAIRNKDGGSHCDAVTGRVLAKVVNQLSKARESLQKTVRKGPKEGGSSSSSAADDAVEGKFIRSGLVAAVSVRVVEPQFEGQTKGRLASPEARKAVERVLEESVGRALELRPEVLEAVMGQARMVQEADEAARKARENARERRNQSRSSLPGKLVDCSTRDPDRAEIFIVEGDSAGGSAKMGRNRLFQAVLPLRGKILNVEKADDDRLKKNAEIAALIAALGLGERDDVVEKRLRYGKVILLTDADVDGAHIRTLLLTFLFRYKPELFHRGHVYVGMPPLFRVDHPPSAKLPPRYCYDDADLQSYRNSLPAAVQSRITVQRFKGLGEMNGEQLWETTMDPARRRLRRMTVQDVEAANSMIKTLMGSEVAPRRAFIEQAGSGMTLEDLDI